jgi:hypothetical protein
LKYEIEIAENISQNVNGQQKEIKENNNSSLKKPIVHEN